MSPACRSSCRAGASAQEAPELSGCGIGHAGDWLARHRLGMTAASPRTRGGEAHRRSPTRDVLRVLRGQDEPDVSHDDDQRVEEGVGRPAEQARPAAADPAARQRFSYSCSGPKGSRDNYASTTSCALPWRAWSDRRSTLDHPEPASTTRGTWPSSSCGCLVAVGTNYLLIEVSGQRGDAQN